MFMSTWYCHEWRGNLCWYASYTTCIIMLHVWIISMKLTCSVIFATLLFNSLTLVKMFPIPVLWFLYQYYIYILIPVLWFLYQYYIYILIPVLSFLYQYYIYSYQYFDSYTSTSSTVREFGIWLLAFPKLYECRVDMPQSPTKHLNNMSWDTD